MKAIYGVVLQHDLGRVCDQVGTLLTQLAASTRDGGGAKEEDESRRTKEQIWNKLEVREDVCVCVVVLGKVLGTTSVRCLHCGGYMLI